MGYLVAAVVLLLIVTLAVIALSVRTAQKGRPDGARDPRAADERDEGDPVIGADEATPLGDTAEHAGAQEGGGTTSQQDAKRHGGTGRPADSAAGTSSPSERAPGGGGAAGADDGAGRHSGADEPAATPASERLADRPR